MTRFLVLLVSFVFAACVIAEQTPAPPTAPRKPRIDGNTRAVSAADIRKVLALMPGRARERHQKLVPIARIHVIDRNSMSVHYWIPGSDIWTYARRIKGRWRIDDADTEKVIITGSYIHAGS